MQFKTKKAEKDFYREILHRWPMDHAIIGADAEALEELLKKHPWCDWKTGAGVAWFFVGLNKKFKRRCFFIRRLDDTVVDFSYIKAIDGDPTDLQEFKNACRSAVAGDMRSKKVGYFNHHGDDQGRVECEVTGKNIKYKESHIDHCIPFNSIVNKFIKKNGILFKFIEYRWEDTSGVEFKSRFLADMFRRHHAKYGVFRVIEAKENLKLSAKAKSGGMDEWFGF